MQQNMMGQNIIITEPSRNLRALGRNALTGKWKVALIAALIYFLCLQVPVVIFDALFGTPSELSSGLDASVDVSTYSSMYNSMPESSFLSDVYTLVVTGPLQLGVTLFFLALFRRQLVNATDIFLGFERFGKALGLLLFQTLFIILWGLLFIVPGIIAAIRYSQAFYILADDPNKGIRQCMNESKMMMRGNKGKYFCLSISFVGWSLLCGVPIGILEGIAMLLNLDGLAYAILTLIQYLFVIPLEVYILSAFAGFYEILAGHLIKETEPAPIMQGAVQIPVAPSSAAISSAPQTAPEPAPEAEKPSVDDQHDQNDQNDQNDQADDDNDNFFIPKEVR